MIMGIVVLCGTFFSVSLILGLFDTVFPILSDNVILEVSALLALAITLIYAYVKTYK